jgi:Cof subfamily protein (haloacid dehalogenase superfamily)
VIKLIALDVDGTLLNSKHQLSARNESALRAAMAKGIQVVIATGKTRSSLAEVIARVDLRTPGVFLQGLILTDSDGNIFRQRTLELDNVRRVVQYAHERRCSWIGYYVDGNEIGIVTDKPDEFTDLLILYNEPTPEARPLDEILAMPILKMLLIHEPEYIASLRGGLETAMGDRVTIVQALRNMIEILPRGASKGGGLRDLLAHLSIDPADVMAVGDGENDVEMLSMVGIGVAMGNGMPSAKAAADHVVASNDQDGVAEAIERYALT